MADGADNAKLQTLLLARNAGKEGSLRVVAERSTQGIANVVAEGGNAFQLVRVGLRGELLSGIGTLSGTPALTIDEDGGVDFVHLVANDVHRLDVVAAHEVETEAVDVVFVDPILHALNHETAHHRLLGSRLVATP